MTNLTSLVNMKPITSLNVIENNGVWTFAGKVPVELAFVDPTPELLEAGRIAGARFGPKKRTFSSRDEAIQAAKDIGHDVLNA